VSHIAARVLAVASSATLVIAVGCAAPRESHTAPNDAASVALTPVAHLPAPSITRAGIAIVGTGGLAGLQRTMVVDSASGHFMAVTRRTCDDNACAPIDSASGTLPTADIAYIYEVVEQERVFAMRDAYGVCDGCVDQALFTTAVVANSQRKVITTDSETTPDVVGRVHVAVAEAIRSARGVHSPAVMYSDLGDRR
jgi:hypothetical protein